MTINVAIEKITIVAPIHSGACALNPPPIDAIAVKEVSQTAKVVKYTAFTNINPPFLLLAYYIH